MLKGLLFVGAAIVAIAVFGWIPFLVVAAGAFIYGIYSAAKKDRSSSQHQTSGIESWMVERNERGNRYMITDPLDAPMNSTEAQRQVLLAELMASRPQMDSSLIAFRQRALNDPSFLTTPEGVEAINGIGAGVFDILNHRVSNWNTNDFRRFGLEVMTAPMPHAA